MFQRRHACIGTVVTLCAVLSVWAQPASGSETAPANELTNPTLPANVVIDSAKGTLSRVSETGWTLEVDALSGPLDFEAQAGMTNIPVGGKVSGQVDIGLHGSTLLLVVDAGDAGKRLAMMELAETDAPRVLDALSTAFPAPVSPAAIQSAMEYRQRMLESVAAAQGTPKEGEGLVPFGSATGLGTLNLKAEYRNSCTCFLACSVDCPDGTLAQCDCQFLGRNSCRCVKISGTSE